MKFENLTSFGEIFTLLMRDRGFSSDEQLARRAMQIQEQIRPRINVQRRTINNWRNNKTMPRSLSDQQFQLVALALKLSDEELKIVKDVIANESNDTTLVRDLEGAEPIGSGTLEAKHIAEKRSFFNVGSLSAVMVLAVLMTIVIWFLGRNDTSSYLTTIPPTQLRVSVDGFVIPNSGTIVISEKQLKELSGWELYVARNEIFARKGRPFVKSSSMCLQSHFDSWSKTTSNSTGWYLKKSGEVRLTDLEYRNAETIRNYECNIRGGQYNCSGQLLTC
ncbi:MAG: YARHG domain-containing protein [Rhodothermales bacterium]